MIIPKILPTINTKRTILTPLQTKHLKYTSKWRAHKRIISTVQNISKFSLNLKDQVNWLKNTRNKRIDYLMINKSNLVPIGVWSLKKFDYSKRYFRIMEQGRYIGNADYLGKGYAKEAALEWLNFGFNYLKLDKIVSIHKKENLIPQKINLNIGFKYFKSYDNRKLIKMEISYEDYINNL